MSLTRTVPAVVPSDFQSSVPWVPSLAAKNSVPPTFVRFPGFELPLPGSDVLDHDGAGGRAVRLPQLSAVGAVVGREEQRSAHVREIDSTGGRRACQAARLMSLTRTVPAAVPSDFHSSVPLVPSLAEKNSVPPTFVRFDGIRVPCCPGRCP